MRQGLGIWRLCVWPWHGEGGHPWVIPKSYGEGWSFAVSCCLGYKRRGGLYTLGLRGCSPPHFQPRSPAGPQRPCRLHPAPVPVPDHPSAPGLLRLQGAEGLSQPLGPHPPVGVPRAEAWPPLTHVLSTESHAWAAPRNTRTPGPGKGFPFLGLCVSSAPSVGRRCPWLGPWLGGRRRQGLEFRAEPSPGFTLLSLTP